MTKTLIVMVGLSHSGKTRRAKEIRHKKTFTYYPNLVKAKAVIVNRDTIRLAHYGERYIAEREEEINDIEETMVKAHFLYGYETVIVDA